MNNIPRCPQYVLTSIPHQALWPLFNAYENSLYSQATGRWHSLTDDFINKFEDEYPDRDMHNVRYATNVNTVHGQAITFYYDIFFPSNVNLDDRGDVELMLHELTHTSQYANRGGKGAFLSEYVFKAAGQIISKRSFNIHDFIDLERDAIEHAHSVIDAYGWEFHVQNACVRPVTLGVHYRDDSGQWLTRTWEFDVNERAFLASGDSRIHSNNTIFYWYARTVDKELVWTGSEDFSFQGEVVKFIKKSVDESAPRFDISMRCP